jgi:hypothetical protein
MKPLLLWLAAMLLLSCAGDLDFQDTGMNPDGGAALCADGGTSCR